MSPRAAVASQGDLFAGGKGGNSRLDNEFAEFHGANPHVYAAMVRLARAAKAAGHDHFGARTIWETLRYERMMKTADPSGAQWKLNDNYISRYARLIMRQEKDLDGLFETRTMTS